MMNNTFCPKCALFFALILFSVGFVSAQPTQKWGDQGNGTYVNPVIPGDYSDIDAIRVGSDYYAISSTFQYSPGLVILHSKDLVNWEILSHVIDDVTVMSPEYNWDRMNRYGKGIWAGSIRYYKGKFWVYFGTPDDGFFMSSATNPAGPWEPLHSFWKVTGWDDCCTFLDDDGQLYFIATNYATDPKMNKKYNIHLFKMNPDGKSLVMESDSIIHQSQGSEANKLYKINGMYYHYFSHVTSEGRVIMMERSKSIYGPYEIKQLNHVNKSTDREPNQGGLIQTESGSWWFFTHHGSSGNWDGRVASLLPVTWVDGWPIIGSVGSDGIGNMVWSAQKPLESKAIIKIQTDDDFSAKKLPVQWEWNYQPRKEMWSLSERPGFLRLHAFTPINFTDGRKIILRAGNTLTQRSMRTVQNVVTVKFEIAGMADGQYAGITHYAGTYSTFGVRQLGTARTLVYDNNGKELVGIKISGNTLWLQSVWGYDGVSNYAYSLDGKTYIPFGDTYPLSWGSYRGDRIGIFCFNTSDNKGFVDVDWFRYNYSSQSDIPEFAQTSAGMKLINAKDKSFMMGWTREEAGTEWACFIGKHKVTFSHDFYMDTTLVTQADYLSIMGVNPSAHNTGDLKLPVENVSWYSAVLYCNARSRRDKLDPVYTYTAIVRSKSSATDSIIGLQCDITKSGYRLPTNAEYEYAERANGSGTYFFADSAKEADQKAEYYAWSNLNSGGGTHPVATKKPNPWGIYDLVGNLFEWCYDWEGPYPVTSQIDPLGPPNGKTECGNTWVGSEKKVAKGGSYKTDVQGHMRINYHFKWPPSSVTGEVGFRCVATKK